MCGINQSCSGNWDEMLVSMELFDGGADGKGGMKYYKKEICEGAMGSVRRLLDECSDS